MNLPHDFVEEIKTLIPNEIDSFLASLNEPSTTSIRINTYKGGVANDNLEPVLWSKNGYYLSEREAFTFDPNFQSGRYYVQDASSMIIGTIISNLCTSPIKYLDLCAAPGGKTTCAIDALPHESLIVANEIIGSRAQILKENIIKWGNPNCIVTNNDSKAIGKLTHFFDIIAADVPCSGEGMFRKDEEAVKQWTPGLVEQCVLRQREIIDNVWNALKPGGYFIYSTCTYNPHEDEEMIDYISHNYGAESIDMNFPKEWNIHSGINTTHHCYRFMPHCTKGEGLFICVLQKPNEDESGSSSKPSKNKVKDKRAQVSPKLSLDSIMNWLNNKEEYSFVVSSEQIEALPKIWGKEFDLIQKELRVIHRGIPMAIVKGKDIIPTQALALSQSLNIKAFNQVRLTYSDSISYLRGEATSIESSERGNFLVLYDKIPIGFIKNIGSRANNLYPKEWRIKSSFIPEKSPNVLR